MTTSEYRVKVYIVGFDKDRAPELKEILRIYNKDFGKDKLKNILRRAWDGEQVQVYQTNDDLDAKRIGGAVARAGAQVMIDGLEDEEEEF